MNLRDRLRPGGPRPKVRPPARLNDPTFPPLDRPLERGLVMPSGTVWDELRRAEVAFARRRAEVNARAARVAAADRRAVIRDRGRARRKARVPGPLRRQWRTELRERGL